MNHLYPLLFVACSPLWVAACSSDNNTVAEDPALIWSACDGNSTLLCTTLDVNVDPTNASSDTFKLALNRLPAINDEREGVILVNPGGPGSSGLEVLETLATINTLPTSLRQKFDFIGFDPRGIGASNAVNCTEFGADDVEDYLTNDQEIMQFIAQKSNVAQRCSEKYGSYLQQVSSLNVVHDMESIRLALNESEIHFIGYSYGTRLGALYQQTYPENSGRFVLDGSLRPESDVQALILGAVQAAQINLESMLAQCITIDQNCDSAQLLDKLTSKAKILHNTGNFQELEIVGELVFITSMEPENAPFLLRPLYDYLQTDDITELEQIYQMLIDDTEDGSDGGSTAEVAVMCADDAVRPDASTLSSLLADYNQLSDLFAEVFISTAGTCSGWPTTDDPLPTITTRQAKPALVIGGTSDAQTPAPWAREMAQAINGIYLESEHLGHTSVFLEKSSCVDAIVEEFLLTGMRPVQSLCPAD